MRLLMVCIFTPALLAVDSSAITGVWKAEPGVTLTITETGLRTYAIRFDRQTTDRGAVSEETTVTCDGRSRPLDQAGSGARGGTVFCGRTYPTEIRMRVTQNDGALIEQVFRASPDGSSLSYGKMV